MLRRIKEYADSAAAGYCAAFCVSVDVSQEDGRRAAALLIDQLGRACVHTYTETMLCQQYPVLEGECRPRADAGSKGHWWQWGNKASGEGQEPAPASLAWGFHLEAVNLWVQQTRKDLFEYVWVLEDDVGFSGDLCSDFCTSYVMDASDLLTGECFAVFQPLRTRSQALVSRWCWRATASDAFLSFVAPGERLKCAEHVQRFSRAFLDRLHELSIGASGQPPVAAWSEMGAPTLCRHLGLKTGHLLSEHIGAPYSFNGRVAQEEWADLLLRRDHAKRRLYHALKW